MKDPIQQFVIYLSNSVHTRRLGKVRPEIGSHMLQRINSYTVHVVLLHNASDPRVHGINHALRLRIEIGEALINIADPAMLDGGLVLVVDQTRLVEVVSFGEWAITGVVDGGIVSERSEAAASNGDKVKRF